MKFVRYLYRNKEQIGLMIEAKNKIIKFNDTDMIGFIRNFTPEQLNDIQNIDDSFGYLSIEDVVLLAPIKKPIHDIICVGVNYLDHLKESKPIINVQEKSETAYFSKRALLFNGPNDLVENHFNLDDNLDYENELAIIIGKEGRDIPIEEVEDYIFGYSIFNDFSARTIQKKHPQWYRGKSFDTFSCLGPCIVHKSELPLPLKLNISTKVNGELRQSSNTEYMIIDVASIIHEITQGITLEPGDIIATGTPAGVGMGFTPPKYLKSNDIVTCEIEKIGILKNTIK